MSVSAMELTADMDVTDSFSQVLERENESSNIYCSCQTEYCDCGSLLGLTKASAQKVYKHLGFQNGYDDLIKLGYRSLALHVWGTHNLSTEDVLTWLSDYNPQNIEWINDACCNVVFANENAVLRAIVDFAEPFDRRVALAAAAALASFINNESNLTLETQSTDNSNLTSRKSLSLSNEALDSVEHFSQYLPPTGRWYKALSVPPQTISLFLRFAHKTDVKLPGAERRSLYYRRFGNPNYGGMTGILTRSYRRRLRLTKQKQIGSSLDANNDSRHVLPHNFAEMIANEYADPDGITNLDYQCRPDTQSCLSTLQVWQSCSQPEKHSGPGRPLVVYDNLYDDDENKNISIRTSKKPLKNFIGQRRSSLGFPRPKSPTQPRKWPRHDRGPAPNRWLLDDDYEFEPPEPGTIVVLNPREPWGSEVSGDPKPFIFSGNKLTNRRYNNHHFYRANHRPAKTITLMPDEDSTLEEVNKTENFMRPRRLLTSMSMVADIEARTSKNRSLIDRIGTVGLRSDFSLADHETDKATPRASHKPSIWQRLG